MSSFQESKIETNVHTLVNKKPRKLGMVLLTFKGHVDSNFLVNHRHISIIERHISHHYVFLKYLPAMFFSISSDDLQQLAISLVVNSSKISTRKA